ncbi:MAG: efflux RND transporter permease subunit [Planctomycetes bacterium]|nr:efflux RND transporter permease subunit [Planctomycetota bacterium]
MTLQELCIRRPVFTTMLIALPVVVGILAYFRMGVDLFPNVDLPIVIITTTRPGASVEEMETGVTKPIEEVVNTISGIDELRSTTKEGLSVVNITFLLEKNRDVAQQEVQGKINTILTQLPTGTDAPIVDKFDVDASPVVTIAVSGKRSLREVTEIADKQIKDQLSSLSGVGSVSLVGGRKRAINITVDTDKLEAYRLSIAQVRQALESQNLELPGGRVDQSSRELVLRTMGRIEDPAQFKNIIIANVNGQPIRIKDVGRAEDSNEEPRGLGRLDGENAVLLVVQKQSGTNTVKVIDTVKARLATLDAAFRVGGKTDLKMEIIRDQSIFINGSLHEVKKHLLLGAMLVSLTILLFLRDWRTMIIASLSIPTSLIATFMVMNWLGFTLNNITMLSLVLSVGIVIDDAVVVHENIFRWMEEKGKSAWDASLGATKEIALAVVATTLSLVVIFLPIAFMSGRVGRFFFSFGVTTAVAIMMSMLVSFTLTPMLCSRFLKLSKKALEELKQGKSHHSGGAYGYIAEKPYLWLLGWSMRHRWAVVLATVLVVASVFPVPVIRYPGLAGMIGLNFIPKDDQSEFEIAITTPPGWSLQHTSDVFEKMEKEVRSWPEVVHVMTTIGDTTGKVTKGQGDVTSGGIYVRLIELEERTGARTGMFDQFDIMDRARRMIARDPEMAELRTSVQLPAAISSGSANADVEFNLVGPDLRKLSEYSDTMIQNLRRVPGLADIDTTTAFRKPELRVAVDRERAMDQQVSIQTIASTLRTLVGGEIVSDFKDNQIGELYDVWLRAEGANREDRVSVERLKVPSKSGLTELGNVAALVEDRGPAQIDRYARQRKIGLIGNLAGATTNVAVEAFNKAFADLHAPPDYQLIATGRAKTQAESNAAFVVALVLSLVFMYMILAAQFESFVHPITILLAVPLTIPFALISLILLRSPLTLYSILGVFLLFGIVKKNGILQVDYTNVLRDRAKENANEVPELYRGDEFSPSEKATGWTRWIKRQPREERVRLWAIMEANRTRLRPILMTTLMLIAGMVPIALGRGPGSGSRASMAQVIVGGQALSLLLSLLVTPVAYSLFDDLAIRFRRRFGKEAAVSEPLAAATRSESNGGRT